MANRNVNKVILVGNLTKDPELRYTPQGNAVCNFTIATNRSWTVDGEEKEAVDFHNVVSWNKLAEICGQLLTKGSMVYVEGRLQTRNWMGDDNIKRYKTEVSIDEMILLRNPKDGDRVEGEEMMSQEDDGIEEMGDVNIDDLLNEIE